VELEMKFFQIKFISVVCLALLITTSKVCAQSSDAVLDLLIKKGVITKQEADAVREQAKEQNAKIIEQYSKVKTSSWVNSINFYGDLRLRMDSINFETDPATGQAWLPNQLLWRYRLRLGMEAKFVDWATINVRLASGDGNPVSLNQTFDQTFRKFGINVDVASVTLRPPNQDWITVIAGKMLNPFWQPNLGSSMIYSVDLTPGGVAEQLQWKFGENKQYRLFAQAGQFIGNLFALSEQDNYIFDQQAGIEVRLGKDPKKPRLKITAAGGYFVTDNMNLVKAPQDTNLGNTLVAPVAITNYLGNFQIGYARGEIAWLVSEQPFLGTPAVFTISGEYDKNFSSIYENSSLPPGNATQGWTLQAAFGQCNRKGQWQVLYQFKALEANAIWDAITDSNWGTGGTDRRGHVIQATYNVLDWWQLRFTSYITEKISSSPNPVLVGNVLQNGHNQYGFAGEYQLRLQADTTFKF
jgi:hypothetical protein